MVLSASDLSELAIMQRIENTGNAIEKRMKEGGLRLHDSMEFYREKGLTAGSPPSKKVTKMELENATTLLVGSDDEEEELGFNEDCFNNLKQNQPVDAGVPEEESSSDEESEDDEVDFQYEDSSETDDIVFDNEDESKEAIVVTPFWFGNEDSEQIKYINQWYYKFLKMAEEKRRQIRQPEAFIGKVKRSKVDNGPIFTTFDEVEIYRRSALPPSAVMPHVRTEYLLTNWSSEEGVPTQCESLDASERKHWKQAVIKDSKPSILLCLPSYGAPTYDYFVSQGAPEVTHSPRSVLPVEQRDWYEKYIPEDLRYCNDGESECAQPKSVSRSLLTELEGA